jgi:hypothetical protein
MYLQVNSGNLRNSVQQPFSMSSYDKWMNVKVAFDMATKTGRIRFWKR